jgi:hypothetical protein
MIQLYVSSPSVVLAVVKYQTYKKLEEAVVKYQTYKKLEEAVVKYQTYNIPRGSGGDISNIQYSSRKRW